jgi:hypothetical protein
MPRPSLYLTLLHRNLGEGHSWVEASDRALASVAHAYDLVKQAVIGPPALRSGSPAASSAGGTSNGPTPAETAAPPKDAPPADAPPVDRHNTDRADEPAGS